MQIYIINFMYVMNNVNEIFLIKLNAYKVKNSSYNKK